jgi:hypothetical protein
MVGWPRLARAQQNRMRRIGVVAGFAQVDREAQARIASLRAGLQALDWSEGRNLQIDERWAAADTDLPRRYVEEVIGLNPDAVVSGTCSPRN